MKHAFRSLLVGIALPALLVTGGALEAIGSPAPPPSSSSSSPSLVNLEPASSIQGRGGRRGKGKGKKGGRGGKGGGRKGGGGWSTGGGSAPAVRGSADPTAAKVASINSKPLPELPPLLPPEPAAPLEPTPEVVHFPDADPDAEREAVIAFFEVCDHDANGWISFREAADSLHIERGEFAIYDRDQDGRVRPPEFALRYRAQLEMNGSFRVPQPPDAALLTPKRTPLQLRNAYDQDADGALDARELRRLLAEYDREELELEVVLEKLDLDDTNKVDGEELARLGRMILAREEPKIEEPPPTPKTVTLEELFGKAEPRGEDSKTAPEPPRILGPIGHFRRLDLDGDGRVGLAELSRLQAPLQLQVRASVVLATLDLDEDGGLSEEEFLAALVGRAR